ncbi:putative ribosome biogenesis GTPase RsgA [Spirochaetia bacterium]|nr:putative ribosome biogenesis GTPase RsgA [Spirochaetia bacterium]
MKGLVIRGSRNIFTVRTEDAALPGAELECRIKGKILKEAAGFYNPLAPGDVVLVEADDGKPGTGLIIALEERRNRFSRFNQKGGASQLLAANVDIALCLTTPASPPFRPRFLDRALLQADAAGITPLVICNKSDLGFDDIDVEERLEDLSRIGYQVLRVSAKTGMGLDGLRALIEGKSSVLVGQSGVGKSSLINALLPDSNIRVGALNEKYNRGNHTTSMSFMIELTAGARGMDCGARGMDCGARGMDCGARGMDCGANPTRLIDTPGIRRFVPDDISADNLILYLREFAPLAGTCTYGLSCSHRTEPGCKIMEAVAAGVIHEDRYNSFLRIHDELAGKNHAD